MPHGKIRLVCKQGVKNYACEICDKIYSNERAIDLHNRYVHPDVEIEGVSESNICGYCRKPIYRPGLRRPGYCRCLK